MVQFYPWFKFFPLLGGRVKYKETKENKIGTKDKFEPQLIYICFFVLPI